MKRRREKVTYNYTCTISSEEFVTTAKAPNPKELLSIKSYYEMNPEMDDRPPVIKKKLGIPLSNEEKH